MMKRRFEIDAESLPDLPGMMLVTVEALKVLGGSATIRELDEKVIELERCDRSRASLHYASVRKPAASELLSRLGRTYLKRGDALVNSSRGVWALTESGAAITGLNETRAVYEKVALEERERARVKRQTVKAAETGLVEPADDDPEEGEDWKSSLLAVLGAMPPDAFERLSQRLLREKGFIKVEVRGKSG